MKPVTSATAEAEHDTYEQHPPRDRCTRVASKNVAGCTASLGEGPVEFDETESSPKRHKHHINGHGY